MPKWKNEPNKEEERVLREKTRRCLRSLPILAGLKQNEWGRRAKVTPALISQYLAGERCPELPTFFRLVSSAGFDLHDWQVIWEINDLLFPSSRRLAAGSRPSLAEDPLPDLLLRARDLTVARLAELSALPKARIRDLLEGNGTKLSREDHDCLFGVLGITPSVLNDFRGLIEQLRRRSESDRIVLHRSPVEALLVAILGTAAGRQLVVNLVRDSERLDESADGNRDSVPIQLR